MESDYRAYLEGKSEEELFQIVQSINKEQFPERYQQALQKYQELKKINERGEPINQYNGEYASVLTRFGALVIDGLLLVPFYVVLMLIIPKSENAAGFNPTSVFTMIMIFLAMMIFTIWNTIVRMGKTGQSLGRKFLNIAVLNEYGKPIGTGNAALREIIGRSISGLVCYIGYLNAFWDKKKQMWHDKMANCYVYYVEDNFS